MNNEHGSFEIYREMIAGSNQEIRMIPIHGGDFRMGSPQGEKNRRTDEGPTHPVMVDDFWMGEMEISWDVYELFLNREIDHIESKKGNISIDIDGVSGATPPYVNYNKNGYPMINVTQYAASQFCKWLTAKTGHYFRLPSEAEWEYACRSKESTAYSFGKGTKIIDQFGWHKRNSEGQLHKSGMKKPNGFGLYDMHGNAAEWVLDSYDPEAYIVWEKGVQNPVKKNFTQGLFAADHLKMIQIGYGRRPGANLHAHGNSATPKFPKVCGGTQTQPILVFVLFVHGPNLQKKIYINCGFVPKKNIEAL